MYYLELYFRETVQYGGATRDRTADLLNANQALSQLSYSPILSVRITQLFLIEAFGCDV